MRPRKMTGRAPANQPPQQEQAQANNRSSATTSGLGRHTVSGVLAGAVMVIVMACTPDADPNGAVSGPDVSTDQVMARHVDVGPGETVMLPFVEPKGEQ